MTTFLLVQTSTNSQEEAQRLADAIVEKRLAASCWVAGPITSTYWWQGKIERAQEWVCTFKTRDEKYAEIEQAIKALHSYEEPGIIATPIVAGSQSYLNWITEETTSH